MATKEVKDKRGEMKRIRSEMDCRTVRVIYGMWCRYMRLIESQASD